MHRSGRLMVDRLASLSAWSAEHRLVPTLIAWSIYVAVRMAVPSTDLTPLVVLPVLLTGWSLGGVIGPASALAALALEASLHSLRGDQSSFLPMGLEAAALLVVGGVAGFLRWLIDRLAIEVGEREAALAQLRDSERRFHSLLDGLPVGVYRSTPDGRILDANRALAEMLGYETKGLLELNALDFYVDPGERELTQGSPDAGSVRSSVEVQLRHHDGSVVWVRDSSRPIYDAQGEVAYSDGILENITAQRMSRAADARFREAFERSPIGMVLIGLDGTLARVNPALCAMLGYCEGDLVGIQLSDLVHPEDRVGSSESVRLLAAARQPSFQENMRFVHRGGSEVWALVNAAPLLDADGRPEQLLAQIVDVTELAEARRALEQLVRSKDEFVASVSHELRTPLTAVHGFASELQLRWDEFSETEAVDLLEMIVWQSAEVANLVEDLLVAARAEIGQLVVVTETVDLVGEVKGVLDSSPEELRLRVRCLAGSCWVAADPMRLRQIIRNLLTNAERYGGNDVLIEVVSDRETARLLVRDNGPGIPTEDRDRVFEAYERAHRRQPSGVGLGLTVSRKLAQMMGGELRYSYEDGWSTFELTLPVAEYHDPAGTSMRPAGPRRPAAQDAGLSSR